MTEFNAKHFSVLERSEASPQGAVGKVPRDFSQAVTGGTFMGELPGHRMSREALTSWVESDGVSPESFFLTTMAWGGMMANHARRAWERREEWQGVVAELLTSSLTRREAYDLLSRANIPGAGPSYFTKLIQFRPKRAVVDDGYIMDQWTAKSIILLTDGRTSPRLIPVPPNGYPNGRNAQSPARANSGADYESFCVAVDDLARMLWGHAGRGVDAEERIFGHGGRNPSAWRSYVVRNFQSY